MKMIRIKKINIKKRAKVGQDLERRTIKRKNLKIKQTRI
jgi:hypothetical protein